MQSFKSGSHTVWDCKYHIVWITKYRFSVLFVSSGNVTDDMWQRYIEDQKPETPDDHFKVV